MPAASTLAATPARLTVERSAITIDGHTLADVSLAGSVYGPDLGTAPVVVIVGGITASPFPLGDATASPDSGRDAWWPALFGPGLVDAAHHTILCPCWPGNGSTWRGFTDDGPMPALSVVGLADLLAAWLDGIGCTSRVTFIGASLGGMVGVAFAVRHAERCAKLISISGGLRPDGWGTATRHVQRELVRDGLRNGDVATGMMRARQLGMLTYRGRVELDVRFGKLTPGLDRPPVAEYLDHHGRRFAERFPVRTFLLLSESIDRGSMGDDARAVRRALARVTAETIVVGVPGDMLFPWALQVELHRELQAAGAESSLWKLESVYGHDAFLADQERLVELLRDAGAFGGELRTAERPRFDGVGIEPLRELRIGLIGCGTVGSGLLDLIDRQHPAVADRYGVRFRVAKVAVRDLAKTRGPRLDGIPLIDDPLDLVSDPDVDVVVELAGGMAMGPVLAAALALGKPVVTANTTLLASKLADLGVLAQRTATPLYCEAAVAAALPIVRHLSHRADEIESLLGIVNGTCNFVMTRLEAELSLPQAVAEAQALGFADADPTADLNGMDAAAKLSILAYRAFGAWVRPDGFPVRGITDLTPADCDLAESMGCRIRLIARAARVESTPSRKAGVPATRRVRGGVEVRATGTPHDTPHGALDMAVEPLLLPTWHLLASVEEEYNAIYLRCASSGDLSFFGKGGGAMPAAAAVLGDLIDLAQDNSSRWPVPQVLTLVRPGGDVAPPARRHYLRVTCEPHPGLERRIETIVRRTGLSVQNRAVRTEHETVQMAFIVSAGSAEQIAGIEAAAARLARVQQCLRLGVLE